MGENPIKLGSMTLLLTIVLLCMAILSVLTLSTARADLSLAEKYADRLQQVYALDSVGQRLLAELDTALQKGATPQELLALLPQDAVLEQDTVTLQLADGAGQTLMVTLELKAKGAVVLQWKPSVEWSPEERLTGLWGAD